MIPGSTDGSSPFISIAFDFVLDSVIFFIITLVVFSFSVDFACVALVVVVVVVVVVVLEVLGKRNYRFRLLFSDNLH